MSFVKLTLNSIKMFYRDWRALFFSLFLPIMFMVIFGIADFGKFANAKIGIVDNANSAQSQEIVDGIKKINILTIKTDPENELRKQLEKGDIDLILILPHDLIKSTMVDMEIPGLKLPANIPKPQKPQFEQTELTALINDARTQQAQSALSILKQVFNQINYKIVGATEIFTFKTQSISNRALSYIDFLIPGIIALSIMQMGLMSIIFTIVGYREKGILKRLQITPIKSFEFTFSQVLTRLLISLIQVTLLILIAVFAFGVNIVGNYGIILLLTMMGAMVFIAIGLAISSIAKTQDTAAPLANIIMMPMMFLGNVFFPVDTMPDLLQKVVQYLPLNYLSHSLREVMINNANLANIAHDVYGLIAWVIGMIIIAALTFRWKTID